MVRITISSGSNPRSTPNNVTADPVSKAANQLQRIGGVCDFLMTVTIVVEKTNLDYGKLNSVGHYAAAVGITLLSETLGCELFSANTSSSSNIRRHEINTSGGISLNASTAKSGKFL